ncbi:Nn.00g005120.m01.CDS01 [Neocucurbitaria sp. VM-36]
MAEGEMVPGDGWFSDESSFYGDDDEQEHRSKLCDDFNSKSFWSTNHKDLNAALAAARAQRHSPVFNGETILSMREPSLDRLPTATDKPFAFSGLDRKAMEQQRLLRLGKRKRDTTPEPQTKVELFNPRQGQSDSWQLGESVDDFVKRLHPLSTSALTYHWIWVENPHREAGDKSAYPRVDDFTSRGLDLLDQSIQNRQTIQAKGSQGARGTLTKLLNVESKSLQQRIADLAAENHVLSGKWMLFPKSVDVTCIWKIVVKGVIDDRLGSAAKVATDDGSEERLICVYTRNFQDVNDVLRVLHELEAMGLLSTERPIYYKPDAYTYLDLRSATATQYGLQASLYNSRTMLASQSTSQPRRKQSTLSKFF